MVCSGSVGIVGIFSRSLVVLAQIAAATRGIRYDSTGKSFISS